MGIFDSQNLFQNILGGLQGSQIGLQGMQSLGQQQAALNTNVLSQYQRVYEDMLKAMGSAATQQSVTGPRIRHTLPEEHIVSAVVGWRRWNVPLFVDQIRSINGEIWPTYKRLEAHCKKTLCEGAMCSCGIYAYKTHDKLKARSEDGQGFFVEGEVWLWGRILECSDGFRAQFGYPKSFRNTSAIAKRIAEVYGVELLEAK